MVNFSKQDMNFGLLIVIGQQYLRIAYYRPIDGLKVGEHPRISELMKSVFHNRPPKLENIFIWGFQRVLDLIK